jgi:mono/diheme cytochrome c family protein
MTDASTKTYGLYLQDRRRVDMRTSIRDAVFIVMLSACVSVALGAAAPQDHQHPAEGAHHHPQAARLKNPVPSNTASVGAGQALYQKQCAGCHGDTGKGDGAMGEELNPKPSNLADADWKHGSTDGEIFTVIRDGIKSTGMKPFGRKMTIHQLWDVVNYVRSIGPRTGPL